MLETDVHISHCTCYNDAEDPESCLTIVGVKRKSRNHVDYPANDYPSENANDIPKYVLNSFLSSIEMTDADGLTSGKLRTITTDNPALNDMYLLSYKWKNGPADTDFTEGEFELEINTIFPVETSDMEAMNANDIVDRRFDPGTTSELGACTLFRG